MKNYNKEIHHRKSIRLKNYNYQQAGLYFITICVKDRQCLLGSIYDDNMLLSHLGFVARDCWQKIPYYYPQVVLHDFVIMPNHLHGIIEIVNNEYSLIWQNQNTAGNRPKGTSQTIGAMVRGFKAGVTSWARKHTEYFDIWQRNYHEHIIRHEQSYLQICEYIQNNPILWKQDCFYQDENMINMDKQ